MPRITIDELRENNRWYFMPASMIKDKDLEIVNSLIDAIENSRMESPARMDNIVYTDKYGSYFPEAMLESDTYCDGLPCIVQSASAHVWLRDDNSIGLSSSGGCYDGQKDIKKFQYAGKTRRVFWTWGAWGSGANHGLYFHADVSCFVYNERAEELRHLTGEFLRPIYIAEHKPDEYGYRFTAYCAGMAWKSRAELDKFIFEREAIQEHTPNGLKYWLKK